MCYGKPGPRCAGHARITLARVTSSFSSKSFQVIRAQEAYDETPEGRKILISQGREDEAAIAKVRYMKKINDYKVLNPDNQDEDMAKIEAEHEADAIRYDRFFAFIPAAKEATQDKNISSAELHAHALKIMTAVKEIDESSISDKDFNYRSQVTSLANEIAFHRNCSTETLSIFLSSPIADPSEWLHATILRHPNVEPSILKAFAANERNYYQAASNPSLDKEDAYRLLSQGDRNLRCWVAKYSANPEVIDYASEFGVDESISCTENPNAPTELMDQLSRSPHSNLKTLSAAHPNTSPEALVVLSKYKNAKLRNNLFMNPNTPPATAIEIARTLKPNPQHDKYLELALRKQSVIDGIVDTEDGLPLNMLKTAYGFGR